MNSRNLTAWELALVLHARKSTPHLCAGEKPMPLQVLAAFNSAAAGNLLPIIKKACPEKVSEALKPEQDRRKFKPGIPDVFRDEIDLYLQRFSFWVINGQTGSGLPSNWKLLSAAGGCGDVYEVKEVTPAIQVKDGRRYGTGARPVVAKVPKGAFVESQLQGGGTKSVGGKHVRGDSQAGSALKAEVERLAILTDRNVLQILGMFQGEDHGWRMIMEKCDSDLENVLYKKKEDKQPEPEPEPEPELDPYKKAKSKVPDLSHPVA